MNEPSEQDPIFPLLTDALRAGPGTPAWHSALEALRARGSGEKDLLDLLSARENLESGKGYRAIRAGPGFTRKLMDALEQESRAIGPGGSGPIAIVSAGVIVLVLVLIGYWLMQPPPVSTRAIDDLSNLVFTKTQVESAFAFGDMIDANWRRIGALDVIEAAKGLRLTDIPPDKLNKTDFLGGGLVSAQPITRNEPIEIEASLRLTKNTDAVVAQVFVTDQDDLSPDRGTGSHELTCLVQSARARVALPGGKIDGKSIGVAASGDSVTIRIIVDKDLAVIDVGPQRIWAGAHALGDKPLLAGVRILAREPRTDVVTFESVRVMRP